MHIVATYGVTEHNGAPCGYAICWAINFNKNICIQLEIQSQWLLPPSQLEVRQTFRCHFLSFNVILFFILP